MGVWPAGAPFGLFAGLNCQSRKKPIQPTKNPRKNQRKFIIKSKTDCLPTNTCQTKNKKISKAKKKLFFVFFLSRRQSSDMSNRKRQQEVYLDQLKQLVPGVNSHTASKVTHSGWSWSNVNWYGTCHLLYQIIIWQLMSAMLNKIIRALDGQLLVNIKYWIRKQEIKPHCSRS